MSDIFAELASLKTSADNTLEAIETGLKTAVDAGQLPLVGAAIRSAFDAGSALHAAESLQTAIDQGIAAALAVLGADSGADPTAALTQAIQDKLAQQGFTQVVNAVVGDQGVTLSLNDSKTVSNTLPLDGNLGLTGLSIQTQGTAQTSLDYQFNLNFRVDAADPSQGVALSGSGLTVATSISVPTLTADVDLGFLPFKVTDNGLSLNGAFSVQLNDPDNDGTVTATELTSGDGIKTKVTGTAAADLHLATDLQNANLPSISADLEANWSLGSNPTLSIDNVTYDLGSFVDNFIKPILDKLDPILQPLHNVIAVLNTDIKPLDGLPGALRLLDKAGGDDGYGNDAPDGRITLLDFIKLAKPDFNLLPAEKFIDTVNNIIDWAAFFEGKNFGPDSYNLGSFSLPYVNGAFQATPSIIAGAANLTAALAGLPNGGDPSRPAGTVLQSLISDPSFSFPIITNPASVFNLLVGGNVDLFKATLPELSLTYGPGFDSAGNPKSPLATLISIPIPVIPGLSVQLQGDFAATMDLGFGYDTRGLQQFQQGGFTDDSKIFDGLYVTDNINGTVKPIVDLTGLIQLAGHIDALLASANAGGNVEANIDFTLNNALGTGDRLYLDQFEQALASNPFQLFQTSGSVSAGFSAYVTVGVGPFSHTWPYNSPRIKLFDFSPAKTGSGDGSHPATSGPPTGGPPPLNISGVSIADSADLGGTLGIIGGTPSDSNATLAYQWQRSVGGEAFTDISTATGATYVITRADIGTELQVVVTASEDGHTPASVASNADTPNLAIVNGAELDVPIPDGDQTYTITKDGTGVAVEAFGRSQHFAGVDSVVVDAGSGGDTVTVDPTTPIPVTINGHGTGTESFVAAAGDMLTGGDGDNYLSGAAGHVTMVGGAGSNFFEGGPQDQVVGGSGRNLLSFQQSAAAVSLDLRGVIAVGHGGNAEGIAFAGIDEFQGTNFGDTVVGGAAAIIFHGGTGNDSITGGSGNDVLEGGGGRDVLAGGNGQDDFILGQLSRSAAQSTAPSYVTITDYASEDKIDLSQVVGSALSDGTAPNHVVRVIEDAAGGFAKLQVNLADHNASANWTTVAHLNGVRPGGSVTAILDPANPAGITLPVMSESFLMSTLSFQGTSDRELWLIGDRPGVEHLFDDINPNGTSNPENFFTVGDQLFFTADDGTHGNELWTTDGTAAGTHLVADINASGASSPHDFREFDDKLVFQADDGVTGNQVWITDGTAAGTQRLTNIESGGATIQNFTEIDGSLYFTGYATFADFSSQQHPRLYRTDGTVDGTNVLVNLKDWSLGTADSSISAPVESNGKLILFISTGGTQQDNLFVLDPSQPLGVRPLLPTLTVGGDINGMPFALNGKATFNFVENVWTSAGTPNTTHGVLQLDGTTGVFQDQLFPIQNLTSDEPLGLAFETANDLGATGNELWVTDGTLRGSHMVKDIAPGAADSDPHALTVTDSGTLFFGANDGTNGDALWKSDGTTAGTTLVKIINPAFQGNPPFFDDTENLAGFGTSGLFFTVHDRVYFTADDGVHGRQLWTSDGTSDGTYSLNVQLSGPTQTDNLSTDGDEFFFTSNFQLWETDGTLGGTRQITDGLSTHTDTEGFVPFFTTATGSAHSDDFRNTYNDTIAALGNVTVGGSATGTIEVSGDKDIFAVTLTAGVNYRFDLEGSHTSGFTLPNPRLQLLDAAGTFVAGGDDISGSNLNAEFGYSAASSGVYYLQATASPFDSSSTPTGTYRVDAQRFDDFRNNINETSTALGSVSVGNSVTGSIDGVGDTDIFAVTLTAGLSYRFDLEGSHAIGFTLQDPFLQLLDSAGNILSTNDNIDNQFDWSSEILYTPAASGTYYLQAGFSPTDTNFGPMGTYRLDVAPPDDFRNTFNDAGTPLGNIAVGGGANGDIESAGDKDVFAITLSAGANYTFNLDGTLISGLTLQDPYLRLLDSAGHELAVSDDISAFDSGSQIGYTATAAGTYYLEASSSPSDFTFTSGTYRLSATQDAAVCFCRGTRIATERGEVAVENLALGDRVCTLSGALKPIVWIGMGRDLVTRANKLARPVIVRQGALDENLPRRDLYLTHGHSLYLDGVLIPVENLINHQTILWDERAQVVEFYHIELEDHDVLLAEGAAAESYHDAGNRPLFHNTDARTGDAPAKPTYAPVLDKGEIVERVWARLFERAGLRTAPETTDDPDMHLTIDGFRIDPVSAAGGVYTFAFDRAPDGEVRLRSRAAVPSLVGVNFCEHRRLGVALRQIAIEASGMMICLDHTAMLLRDGGAHAPETAHCWTDGDLLLPARLFAALDGQASLVVSIMPQAMRYPIAAVQRQAA